MRDLIETDLSDPYIQTWLDRVARTVSREYDADAFADDQHRADLESALAAFRIVTTRDRRPSSVSLGNASKTYDTSQAEHLNGLVRRAAPAAGATERRDPHADHGRRERVALVGRP